jgi:hypothetical protein
MNPTEFDLDNYDPGAYAFSDDYIDPDYERDMAFDWED